MRGNIYLTYFTFLHILASMDLPFAASGQKSCAAYVYSSGQFGLTFRFWPYLFWYSIFNQKDTLSIAGWLLLSANKRKDFTLFIYDKLNRLLDARVLQVTKDTRVFIKILIKKFLSYNFFYLKLSTEIYKK